MTSPGFNWNHLPLELSEGTKDRWCLEWPVCYFLNPRLVLLLTLEQPVLLKSPTWSRVLETQLRLATKDAGISSELLRHLARHKKYDVVTSKALTTKFRSYLPRDDSAQGVQELRLRKSHDSRTLQDHDRVERLMAIERLKDLGIESERLDRTAIPTAPTKEAAFIEAATVRVGERRSGSGKQKGTQWQKSKNRHERVAQVRVLVPYVVVECSHDEPTLVLPQTQCHVDLEFPCLDDVLAARTIMFRYRAGMSTPGLAPPLPPPPESWSFAVESDPE